jgi:hypothetical protein
MSSGHTRDLVFVSYSHENPAWKDRLLVLLKPFVKKGQLQVWADQYIEAGSLWRREIDAALARTRVGVVLLNPNLLASDFVTEIELPHLMQGARSGVLTLLVVPIEALARDSTRFPDGDLVDFQWPWSPKEPLDELPTDRRNRALVTVTEAIVQAAGSRGADVEASVRNERIAQVASEQSERLGPLHGLPPLPPNYVRWEEAHDQLKRALLGTSSVVGVSARAGSVGVHGQGGLGKTVIAQAVVSDEDVRRAFPNGVFWVTLGQQPRLEALQMTLAAWCGNDVSIAEVAAGTRVLQETFREKACLVVLDDVWQFAHAKAFDVLEGASRLLVTTRDRSLLTALGARNVRLETLPAPLALELLAQWAGLPVLELPAEAATIAREIEYLPLALALAGAQIREGASWERLLLALREGNLIYLDHPYGSVFKSLQASLTALDPADAARYLELAVFPEDEEVPVSIVERFWRATSGEDPLRLDGLLTRLASRSLLRRAEPAAPSQAGRSGYVPPRTSVEPVVTMHDLQHDFVRLLAPNLPELHARLIDTWSTELPHQEQARELDCDRWTALPSSPSYPWQFLAYHLRQAGRDDELEGLLTSPDWLYARLTRFSVPALLRDFGETNPNPSLRSIRDALILSAHVLSRDPTALPSQLAGRLLTNPDQRVRALIETPPRQLRQRTVLRPINACLTPAGRALRQTFAGHSGSVDYLAVIPDGLRVVSGRCGGGELKLWDLTTGTVLQTIEGDNTWVHAMAVLSDGQRVLTGSNFGTLKLWDLITGTLLQTNEGPEFSVRALAVLPDGQRVLWGGVDGTLKLWDLPARTVLQTFEGHQGIVTVLPDGERALTGGEDGSLRLWDLTTGAVLHTLPPRA